MLKMVDQSIASTSSPQRETRIRALRVFKFNLLRKWLLIAFCLENPLSQIAILDGMGIIFLPKLHKFRPIGVPFQIATTYAPSLKYRFVLTLMSQCFRKFQEFSPTHVLLFFNVLKLQQYPFEPQFGICDSVTIIAWMITRAKRFGRIEYWKVWETIVQSMNNSLHIRCTQQYTLL
jgi:hypothetical protein